MEMGNTIQKMTDRWRAIREGAETFGSGTTKEQADAYYNSEVKHEVIRIAKNRYAASGKPRKLDFLISMSGFSPMTTIIAYELLRPKRLLVIGSEDANTSFNIIAEHIIDNGRGRLSFKDILNRQCSPTEPHIIYRVIREELETARSSNWARGRISAIIDITGGKKVMSAAAAHAAWRLNLPLCYVDSRYNPVLRQPDFGSEELIFIDNPDIIYGDEEMLTGRELFLNGHYDRAYECFKALAEKVSEPESARFLRDLSDMYRAWCNLEINRLPEVTKNMTIRLNAPVIRHEVKPRERYDIQRQIEFLERLADKDESAMLLSYFLLGQHYAGMARYDFAVLLFYRTIEMCLRQRLELSHPGFTTSAPDYGLLPFPQNKLVDRYNRAAANLASARVVKDLPPILGLMTSALLLAAIDDPLAVALELRGAKGISRIRNACDIRNKSVLAHGCESVTSGNSKQLESTAKKVIEAAWNMLPNATALGADATSACMPLRFLRTTDE